MHACTHSCTYVCMFKCLCTCACIHLCVYTHLRRYIKTHRYIYMCMGRLSTSFAFKKILLHSKGSGRRAGSQVVVKRRRKVSCFLPCVSLCRSLGAQHAQRVGKRVCERAAKAALRDAAISETLTAQFLRKAPRPPGSELSMRCSSTDFQTSSSCQCRSPTYASS